MNNIIADLKQSGQYDLVSFRQSSIPGPGAPCLPIKGMKENVEVEKVIRHRNQDVTVVTPHGWVKFWHIRDQNWLDKNGKAYE